MFLQRMRKQQDFFYHGLPLLNILKSHSLAAKIKQ